MKRLLLIGGGHAHVQALQAFAREALPGVQTTLVTPFARSLYSGMLPGLVAGHYARAQCELQLQALAERAHATLSLGTAVALDAAQRSVTLADGRVLGYDVLSLDLGSQPDRDAIPGAREQALFLRPPERFAELLEDLWAVTGERVFDLVVVGGGAAGVEIALAFGQRLRSDRDDLRVRLSLVTGAGAPLPGYPPGVRARAEQALRRLRITVLNERCVEVTAHHVLLSNGARLACDAPVMALPGCAPAWLAGSGLALDEQGWVSTLDTLQSVNHPEVFAAGDVAARRDDAVPRSGVYAVRAGPALAFNLRRFLAGGELRPWHPQRRSLNLLACGPRYAIASWGGWSAEGRWAWWWKDRIDRGYINRMHPGRPPV